MAAGMLKMGGERKYASRGVRHFPGSIISSAYRRRWRRDEEIFCILLFKQFYRSEYKLEVATL